MSSVTESRQHHGCAQRFVSLAAAFVAAVVTVHPATAQVVGQSVNMVTGTQWPTGDPFLERQNEPSMAVSSRNPLHLVAGNNDYRTVDLPGLPYDEPTGDAWLGFFTSIDGGNSWESTLVPGYPQDTSSVGTSSPLHLNSNGSGSGYSAGADATVRAGTNGLFYYSGLAFNRENTTIEGGSAIFLARYVDDNNFQGANTVRYIDTHIVASYNDSAPSRYFADKPFMAVDMPRGSGTCTIPAGPTAPAAIIPAGRIYIGYTLFTGGEASNQSSIMLTYSNDCGVTWTTPQQVSGSSQTNQGATLAIDPENGNLYIAWRIFKDQIYPDEIAGAALQYGSNQFTPILGAPISPFDQGTSAVTFRTNAYPSIAVDNAERLYVAWSQRGSTTNTVTGGDARIQLITGVPTSAGKTSTFSGMTFSKIITVDPYAGRGHQVMPALAFSSGKLTVAWYDFRNDDEVEVYTPTAGGGYSTQEEFASGVAPVFAFYITDPANPLRHTVDVRAAQALPGSPAQFSSSVLVSEYAFGAPPPDVNNAPMMFPNDPDNIQQLEFDPPNLPLFGKGTAAFVGDYMDVAGPTFLYDPSAKQWRFNNQAGDPDHTHVVWTDNRNVVQPADGKWADFTPVGSTGGPSVFDGTPTPACIVGQTGVRNQDIFTAALSSGIIMGSRGNFKQLSTSIEREFPVTVENPTGQTLYFRLTLQSQPVGGAASFQQFPLTGGHISPLNQVTIGIPALSSASRSVFVTSSNPTATVLVTAIQTSANNKVLPNGLTSSVTLNTDPSNPLITNPGITTTEVYTPNISNPDISNPDISNPDISNPDISNPDISNPDISNVTFANPDISNPDISNPDISNPDISNPDISNPDISNVSLAGGVTDANYTVSNAGDTSVSYTVNLVQSGTNVPSDITAQLIVAGVYYTPVANGCTLAVQAHYTPIVNVVTPVLQPATFVSPLGPPPALAPTFTLEPGQKAIITIRLYGPATDAATWLTGVAPVVASQAVGALVITTTSLPNGSPGGTDTYSASILATGGTLPYKWTVTGLPSNLTATPDASNPNALDLNSTSAFSDTGNVQTFSITFKVTDASGQKAQQTLTLTVSAG